ncbi:MAG: hypothetical protein KGJ79_03210 [Alphaproteobacteria bacterium]|nr:hypothetical protein [Alphaproteobacteria bacterium]MDE2492755.1 hypothetical protein [Alphaproteobacteria bacterium]
MRMLLHIWRDLERAGAKLNDRWGKVALHLVRWAVPAILIAFLIRSLTQIGWGHVWVARPGALSFYLVLLLPFFVQPVADLVIYRNLLSVGRALPFFVMLRKRYLNSFMLDYSGEAYFFLWARRNLELKKGLLLHAVKDTNVLSAGASLVMVWLMLLALIATGGVKLPAFLPANLWTFALIGSLPLALSLGLIVGGRKVTSLSRGEVATTFSIHFVRSAAALLLEFALWWLSGALPSAAVCVEFVALRLLVTRLPLVPNKELVFVGVGIATAGLMNLSAPRVAAVLVIMTAFSQIQELMLVGLPWLFDQLQIRRSADEAAS